MSEAVYLTKARAQQAFALAEPTILKMMQTVTNKKAMHIVALALDGSVLHEASIGPDVEADAVRLATCKDVAKAKAQIHYRNGRPSLEIQARRPHTLVVGDTIWGGSGSYEGVIVAASGVQSCYDESISAMIAAILWSLCCDAQVAHLARTDKTPIYKQSI